jgi:hypothetical protein
MSKKFDHIDASEPVSTVTKHIKIYSDNPIHDCIDRIISYTEYLELDSVDKNYALDCVREAASELAELCLDKKLERMNKLIYKLCEKIPD